MAAKVWSERGVLTAVLRAETRAETRSQDLMKIELVLSRDQIFVQMSLGDTAGPCELGFACRHRARLSLLGLCRHSQP